VQGFLKKLGVNVQQLTPDLVPIPEPEDDLPRIFGRLWELDGDEAADAQFANEVHSLLNDGGTERVIDVCQQLLGENNDMSIIPQLQMSAALAHRSLTIQMG
jgi:hypothetical protein